MKPPIEYRAKPSKSARRQTRIFADIASVDVVLDTSDPAAILEHIRALNRKRARAYRAKKKAEK